LARISLRGLTTTVSWLPTLTVNGQRYLDMLQRFVIPQLVERGVLDTVTFMQDGAPPHFTCAVTDLLRERFGDWLIGRNFTIPWPARSPDLTPMDYWFWGYLKSKVYQKAPATLPALRLAIRECIDAITQEQLQNGVYHSITRMQAIMDNEGGHIEHLLP